MNINKVFDGVTNLLGFGNNDKQTQTNSQTTAFVPQRAVDGWLANLYRTLDTANTAASTGLAHSVEPSKQLLQAETTPQDEINGLRVDESISIKVEINDTQETVLRKAYGAYADKAGLSAASKQQYR